VTVGANVASGSAPFAIAVDPTGRFAYVANQSGNSVAAFNINATTGALSIIGTTNVTAGNSPVAIAVDATGRFVFVANENDNAVQTYSIDFTSVALTNVSTTVAVPGTAPRAIALTAVGSAISLGTSPRSVTVDPAGGFVYAGNSDTTADSISGYCLNASTGALTSLGTATPAGTESQFGCHFRNHPMT
jgi:6-phosphogluconolactonase